MLCSTHQPISLKVTLISLQVLALAALLEAFDDQEELLIEAKGEYTENLHKRDNSGQFAKKAGTAVADAARGAIAKKGPFAPDVEGAKGAVGEATKRAGSAASKKVEDAKKTAVDKGREAIAKKGPFAPTAEGAKGAVGEAGKRAVDSAKNTANAVTEAAKHPKETAEHLQSAGKKGMSHAQEQFQVLASSLGTHLDSLKADVQQSVRDAVNSETVKNINDTVSGKLRTVGGDLKTHYDAGSKAIGDLVKDPKQSFKDLGAKMQKAMGDYAEKFGACAASIFGAGTSAATTAIDYATSGIDSVGKSINSGYQSAKSSAGDLANQIKEKSKPATSAISNAVGTHLASIGAKLNEGVDAGRGAIASQGPLAPTTEGAKGAVVSAGKKAAQDILKKSGDALRDAGNQVKTAGQNVVTGAKSTANDVLDSLAMDGKKVQTAIESMPGTAKKQADDLVVKIQDLHQDMMDQMSKVSIDPQASAKAAQAYLSQRLEMTKLKANLNGLLDGAPAQKAPSQKA